MARAIQFFALGSGALVALAVVGICDESAVGPSGKVGAPLPGRLCRPIGLLLTDDGQRLLVANRDRGTIVTLDTAALRPVHETKVGTRLAYIAGVPGTDLIVAADETAGEVVVLANRRGALREIRRLKVGMTPVGVCASEDGSLVAVACLWPRRLFVFDLAAIRDGPICAPVIIDLPFAPRRLLALPRAARMLVADSFGGHLAVVDLRRARTESIRTLHAHNIRGLTLDQRRTGVLLAHQILYRDGHTVPGDIRSGNVVNNFVRRLSLDVVLDPRADLLRDDWRAPLGDVERGAGDPAAVAETADGRLLVALAGVNELAIGQREKAIWTRLPIGAGPSALAVDPVRRRAYVANTFADSITAVDLDGPAIVGEARLNAVRAPRAEERGEALFHDARLSLEGWYSCHSCHTDGHTNGGLNDNFTDGSFGTPKRVLSLQGTGDTGPWAWNGRMAQLKTQVHTSVKSSMQGAALSPDQVGDLTAYLRSLPPAPALSAARGAIDKSSAQRGQKVFTRAKCGTCHTPPAYTSAKTYDVGIRDEAGTTNFNPPSLRGVSQGGPYFHDGRAATLEEIFTRHAHPAGDRLSGPDLRDLLCFLNSL